MGFEVGFKRGEEPKHTKGVKDQPILYVDYSEGTNSNGTLKIRMAATRKSSTWNTKCLEENKTNEQKTGEAIPITGSFPNQPTNLLFTEE
jgi:hypothetical protein